MSYKFLHKNFDGSQLDLGSGEHGIGVGKREYLIDELGNGTVELMRTVKRAIDPLNLFNPGKVSIEPSPSKDNIQNSI